jgi:hypothetical protein
VNLYDSVIFVQYPKCTKTLTRDLSASLKHKKEFRRLIRRVCGAVKVGKVKREESYAG